MAEKEYIEREAALDAILTQPPDAHYPEWYAWGIREIPAADVVEVVRCKDCKYRYAYSDFDRRRQETYVAYECSLLRRDLGEDGFCSCGVPKPKKGGGRE